MTIFRSFTVASQFSTCTVETETVVTEFPDGYKAVCEIGRGNNPYYRDVAADCGYGRNWRRYAQHHDLFHSVLWEAIHREPSPVLWGVAHGLPHEGADEEWMVNTVQMMVATGRRDIHADRLRLMMGPRWEQMIDELAGQVTAIGLPVR